MFGWGIVKRRDYARLVAAHDDAKRELANVKAERLCDLLKMAAARGAGVVEKGTFEWALFQMKQGARVRAPEWPQHTHLRIDRVGDESLLIISGVYHGLPRVGEYALDRKAILYEKWELAA